MVGAKSRKKKGVAARYSRANSLVGAVLNKFHNGSARAVDPFVVRTLREHEPRLLGIQCFLEQGPAENSRQLKRESHVADHISHPSGVFGLFTLCGGFFGPGKIMREWDECSGTEGDSDDREAAMAEYVATVDKILPGWDETAPDHPVASTDRFWADDGTATHCPLCFVVFSILEIALCPGAPLRPQRVCTPCFQAEYRAQQLREAKKMSRENQEIEQRIRGVLSTARQTLAAKQEEEQKLRVLAVDAGCDVEALDEAIQKQHGGSPIGSASMELPVPPAAHRFTPTQTSVESSNQLALAHRQLTMSFKVVQCRAHRVLDKMDATIAALQEALNTQKAPNSKIPGDHSDERGWSVMIRHTDSFLTPRDREALQIVSEELRTQLSCRRSTLGDTLPPSSDPSIAMLWQTECLEDNRTRAFIVDLAEAVRARLDTSSGSDTEDSDANEAPVTSQRPLWEQPMQSERSNSTNRSLPTFMELEKAYELICSQCEVGTASEWDEQIRLDVTRTFGISARRQHRKSIDLTSRTVCNSAGVTIPVEKRQASLQNVLRACASVDTEVGYCQGMDHVAALMLAVSDWNESRAFWLLVSLLSSPRFELERLYGPGLPHLSLRCFQLDRLLGMYLRPLSEHFQTIDFPISIVATGWFMTLFSNMEALVYEVVVHVFEGFIFKGWKQLFQTALVIMAELQKPILASSFDEIPRLFYDIQEYAPQLSNVQYVLTQSSKYEVPDQLLKRLEMDFEQETPVAAASPRKSLVARRGAAKLADQRNGNQRSPKRRASLPPPYPRPEAQQEELMLPLKSISKAPSSTRQASPSQMSPAVV
ncbi:GTPase-activating protein GYP5 [Phytophthora citrophthora]|uniref:GTPase-activating protein GYP5 n=1 Tax=Phytophthora citrophthora TaxID=4793 RepID=A0AAD9GA15_9STRA|nr:GTPase-activating protein GYP5 [Phytophthora citrophthora]